MFVQTVHEPRGVSVDPRSLPQTFTARGSRGNETMVTLDVDRAGDTSSDDLPPPLRCFALTELEPGRKLSADFRELAAGRLSAGSDPTVSRHGCTVHRDAAAHAGLHHADPDRPSPVWWRGRSDGAPPDAGGPGRRGTPCDDGHRATSSCSSTGRQHSFDTPGHLHIAATLTHRRRQHLRALRRRLAPPPAERTARTLRPAARRPRRGTAAWCRCVTRALCGLRQPRLRALRSAGGSARRRSRRRRCRASRKSGRGLTTC